MQSVPRPKTRVSECKWRKQHFDNLVADIGSSTLVAAALAQLADCLTYCQVMELHGLTPPVSARERNALNLITTNSKVWPLGTTMAMCDLSQSMNRNGLRVDGTVPTMATNAAMFSLDDGNFLSLGEMAKLMGHDIVSLKTDGITGNQFRRLLGMSVHVAVAGYMVIGLLSAMAYP